MSNSEDYTSEELTDDLTFLILRGFVEVKGMNEYGEMLYGLTDEYRENKKTKIL